MSTISIKQRDGSYERVADTQGMTTFDNSSNYSLSETKVGYWIDGKPIYKITRAFSNVAINPTESYKYRWTHLFTITDADFVIQVEVHKAIFSYKSGRSYAIYDNMGQVPTHHQTTSDVLRFNFTINQSDNSAVGMETYSENSSDFALISATLTAFYTKTTD